VKENEIKKNQYLAIEVYFTGAERFAGETKSSDHD
jgi:hypothetical protein